MVHSIPKRAEPDWLSRIQATTIDKEFPLKEVLQDSVYYPASGIHGEPVRFLSENFASFVYVDYGVHRDQLMAKVSGGGFLGYDLVARRTLSESDLAPEGWSPVRPGAEDGDPEKYRDWGRIKSPFCEWLVFQRKDGFDDNHGARRFSLLYMCADGVAAFQALYVQNAVSPGAIAIIQPGTGFGGNWTDFTDPKQILARTVMGNPAGPPAYLLYGGSGGLHFYNEPCWPAYSQGLGFLGKSSIGVWHRPE